VNLVRRFHAPFPAKGKDATIKIAFSIAIDTGMFPPRFQENKVLDWSMSVAMGASLQVWTAHINPLL
jgi:hypothetical protein